MNRTKNTGLEVLVRSPQEPKHETPLLFVHGAFVGAWCWDEHFLQFFADAGYAAHAVSLSGHGGSRGRERLDTLSIADYVNDVREVAERMPVHPVLIGHSMGGFVVQKYLERHHAPAAVMMCPVPPQGLMASAFGLLFSRPSLLRDLNSMMGGGRTSYETMREAMFAQEIAFEDLKRFSRLSQPESHRAIWDMTLFGLPSASKVMQHLKPSEASGLGRPLSRKGGRGESLSFVPKPEGALSRLLVLGAEHDHLIPASSAQMTARTYSVEAEVLPGFGHGMMLEKDWELVAGRMLEWMEERQL